MPHLNTLTHTQTLTHTASLVPHPARCAALQSSPRPPGPPAWRPAWPGWWGRRSPQRWRPGVAERTGGREGVWDTCHVIKRVEGREGICKYALLAAVACPASPSEYPSGSAFFVPTSCRKGGGPALTLVAFTPAWLTEDVHGVLRSPAARPSCHPLQRPNPKREHTHIHTYVQMPVYNKAAPHLSVYGYALDNC